MKKYKYNYYDYDYEDNYGDYLYTKNTSSKNPEDYKPNKFYIAYGSNMNLSRLKSRCPNSEYIGIGVIEGYKLIFRKSASGFYASLDKVDYKKKKKRKSLWSVPVAIFKISKVDEESLDKFEGCPKWYKKVELKAKDNQGDIITGIGYVLPETSTIGVPSSEYYSIILNAYESLGIDSKVLEKAFLVSYKKSDNLLSDISKKIKKTKTERQTNDNLEIRNTFQSSSNQIKYYQPSLFPCMLGSRIFSFDSERFLKEFERELESRLSADIFLEVSKDELNILDAESGETYFIVYPPSGNTFYLENIMEGDVMDYTSVDEAIWDIISYFSNRR